MDRMDIHPSHQVETFDGGIDPHSPLYRCLACRQMSCTFCRTGRSPDDAEMQAPCPGKPWWED